MNRVVIPSDSVSRREWLLTALAAAASLTSGCQKAQAEITGELFLPGMKFGHQIRDSSADEHTKIDGDNSDIAPERTVDVAIVGGGVAGLSAAWQLQRLGIETFRIFELEQDAGGTSRSGSTQVTSFPWGAHYVPMPDESNRDLIELFQEMGAIQTLADGSLVVTEGVACREPQERLFVSGEWMSDLYPHSIASESDLTEWDRFREVIHSWIDWRDTEGRRAFCIPSSGCSQDPQLLQLDQQSALEWLNEQGFSSEPLRWLVDYCCRDDYGLAIDQCSAWAALFYFASRLTKSGDPEPPLLTWPAGNGAIVRHLASRFEDRIQTGCPVVRLVPGDVAANRPAVLHVWDGASNTIQTWNARHVIFAAPQFLTPHVIAKQPKDRVQAVGKFFYGAWVVANLHLTKRPESNGSPLSWDNVIYLSASLGYVVATHQVGSDYGPTVWTWYYPLCDPLPSKDRERLLAATWSQWVEIILQDLGPSHPDLRDCLQRVDVMIWGHAMIQPRPGFVTSSERILAAAPLGNIHFAGADLSGLALMEEAFDHGLRAAREVLASHGQTSKIDPN